MLMCKRVRKIPAGCKPQDLRLMALCVTTDLGYFNAKGPCNSWSKMAKHSKNQMASARDSGCYPEFGISRSSGQNSTVAMDRRPIMTVC